MHISVAVPRFTALGKRMLLHDILLHFLRYGLVLLQGNLDQKIEICGCQNVLHIFSQAIRQLEDFNQEKLVFAEKNRAVNFSSTVSSNSG